eukprot:3636496-Amphidinium_carterae.1
MDPVCLCTLLRSACESLACRAVLSSMLVPVTLDLAPHVFDPCMGQRHQLWTCLCLVATSLSLLRIAGLSLAHLCPWLICVLGSRKLDRLSAPPGYTSGAWLAQDSRPGEALQGA